jgi:hypothetical protein
VLRVHFSFGFARHMGQRTDKICRKVSVPGPASALFDIASSSDGQCCSSNAISKRAPAIELIRYRRRQMGQGNMLVDRCCGLRAAIAVQAAEIESGHALLAEGAFECSAAVDRFGCVISHIFSVVLLTATALGH